MRGGAIDLGQPVNMGHTLNRGRVGWWYGLPNNSVGLKCRNILPGRRFEGSLTASNWKPISQDLFGVDFTGATSNINFGDVAGVSGATRYSFAVDLYADGLGGSNFGRIFTKNDNNVFALLMQSATQFTWYVSSSSNQIQATVAASTLVKTTIHGSYSSGVTGGTRIFINGKLNNSSTVTSTVPTDTAALILGNNASINRAFDGRIWNFRLWVDRALSDGDVASDYELSLKNYRAPNSPLNFLRSWSFGSEITSGGTTVTPDTASLTLTTFAPTVSTPVAVTPATLSLQLATFAPTVSAPVAVTPSTLALTLTTFAPTVTATDNQTVTPDTASLILTTFAPTVTVSGSQTVTPDTASLTLTTFAPTVSTPVVVTPSVASLTITLFAPTVTNSVVVTPSPLSLVLTTFAPTVTASGNQSLTPLTSTLVLAFFAPTVTATGGVVNRIETTSGVYRRYETTSSIYRRVET